MTSSMLYDSEYDNYGPSSLASDDLYDDASLDVAASKQLIGGEDKIRRVSQHITRSFGQPSQRNLSTSSDSEDAWKTSKIEEEEEEIGIHSNLQHTFRHPRSPTQNC